jgi:hypothetical protein
MLSLNGPPGAPPELEAPISILPRDMKQTRVSFDISSIFRAHAAQIELRTSGNLTGARTEAQRAAQT